MSGFNDEHSGKGGSYVAGEDGKRVLKERTDYVAPEAQTKSGAPAVPVKKNSTKGVSDAKSS